VIRVAVAASSAVVRAGLESVVRASDGLDLVGVMRADEVGDRLDESAADVLLLELAHLDEDWMNTLSESSVPVVLLVEIANPAVLAAGLRANIRAVISPDANPAEIEAAIRSTAAGLITIQQSTLELLAIEPRATPAALEEPLSPRELEVLAMLAEGLSNKLIAHRLAISEHTVKFHVASIMAKLRAGSRTDAVMQGIRRGLVMI
jgi:two-component system, NarL family, response regulator YdfI